MAKTYAFVAIPLVALLAGAGIKLARPLPPVSAQAVSAGLKIPGVFSIDFPARGQAAIGEESLGVVSSTPGQQPVPIASLTKMMTAYLYLQARPLRNGEDGPITTVKPADVLEYQQDKAAGDSVVKVKAGDRLTERQMLQGLLLPSGDNIATMIARQVAGNQASFVKKMNDAAHTLGMAQTTYADASGVNPATVSTARDQLLMAQAAMRIPIFQEIVRMPQADLPAAGRVYNVNAMVGKQGIAGIKTGSTLAAGSCFVGALPVKVHGTGRIVLAAILGQQSLRLALALDTALLHAAAPQFNDFPLPLPSTGLAELQAAWQKRAPLNPGGPLELFGYPGMPIDVTVKVNKPAPPIAAGNEVATAYLKTGTATTSVALFAKGAIDKPGLLWKLFH